MPEHKFIFIHVDAKFKISKVYILCLSMFSETNGTMGCISPFAAPHMSQWSRYNCGNGHETPLRRDFVMCGAERSMEQSKTPLDFVIA